MTLLQMEYLKALLMDEWFVLMMVLNLSLIMVLRLGLQLAPYLALLMVLVLEFGMGGNLDQN